MTTEGELSPAAVLSIRLPAVGSPEDGVESGLADRLSRVVESAAKSDRCGPRPGFGDGRASVTPAGLGKNLRHAR